MTSGKLLPIVGIVVWSGVALAALPRAVSHGRTGILANREEDAARSCSDLRTAFDHKPAVIESEERTISKVEAPVLRVSAEPNGGIQVLGWDQDSYSVTLCKAVEAGGDQDALLREIHLDFQSGELRVAGPSLSGRWSVHLLIRSPRAASLDLKVHNGPLSLRGVDGSIKVRAQNGPVSVSGCSGELDLESQNGPLTLEDNRGKQNVRIANGPVTVSLSGDSWVGSGLEAHGKNGPVTLRIPSGYRTGVLLESEGRSPFECRASVCSEGRKTWEDDRKRIEFGSGPTLVHVSTENGPLSVD